MIELFVNEHLPMLHMWLTFALIILALALYSSEKIPLELTSLIILITLMLLFQFAPLRNADGEALLQPDRLLLGFANPALITVMCLLIIGQAIIRTGSLNEVANFILRHCKDHALASIVITLFTVTLVSAFVNDTPTCVIFLPIIAAIAKKLNLSASKVMIPLSYASILGGITTLVGSSTNLLVSGALVELGQEPLGIFDFTLPGICIALAGLFYISFILPHLLPDRAPLASEVTDGSNRQFIVQLDVDANSTLVGRHPKESGLFASTDISMKMIHRGEHAYLPPFDDDLKIRPHDILVVATPRSMVSSMFNESTGISQKVYQLEADLDAGEGGKGDTILAEIVVAPASRIIGQSISQLGFYSNHRCMVLGIQRRARVITSRLTEIRLAAGDVLLVMGSTEDVFSLRSSLDVLLMEWSTEELPSKTYARRVNMIFAGVVAVAAFEWLPIHISALIGVLLVILAGCINLRQALRALNSQIIMLVAAGLALSTSLEVTGGAQFLAENLIAVMQGASPLWIMGALFMTMAIFTNVLSNNACALIFTPIAFKTAMLLGADPRMFIFAVIFASNCCSFATPIGYQTNLLVMAPGHYRFSDYMKAGLPLILIVFTVYMTFSYFYFGYANS